MNMIIAAGNWKRCGAVYIRPKLTLTICLPCTLQRLTCLAFQGRQNGSPAIGQYGSTIVLCTAHSSVHFTCARQSPAYSEKRASGRSGHPRGATAAGSPATYGCSLFGTRLSPGGLTGSGSG
jgi:hypothetical protein